MTSGRALTSLRTTSESGADFQPGEVDALRILRQIGHLYEVERQLRENRAGPRLREAERQGRGRLVLERIHRALLRFQQSRRHLPNGARLDAYQISMFMYMHQFSCAYRFPPDPFTVAVFGRRLQTLACLQQLSAPAEGLLISQVGDVNDRACALLVAEFLRHHHRPRARSGRRPRPPNHRGVRAYGSPSRAASRIGGKR